EDQLPAHGDYRCFDTVGGSVILLRDGAVLRAFANVCRHRGPQLLDGLGRIDRIVCPYHAWSYRVSGDLLGCPDMGSAEDFDRSASGLIPVRVGSWGGVVFVQFSGAA